MGQLERAAWAAGVLLLLGCGPCARHEPYGDPPADASPARIVSSPSSSDAPQWEPLTPGDALASLLAARRRSLFPEAVSVGQAQVATLEPHGRARLGVVLQSGYCFRIIAAGGRETRDVDLFLFDPDGTALQQDALPSRTAAVGRHVPICPPKEGRYELELRMFAGQGRVAVRLLRDPLEGEPPAS